MRTLQERWEEAGKVPRDVMRSLEDRMGAVEEKVRSAGEAGLRRTEESPFTTRLREKVVELEGKLAKAQVGGRPTQELEAALTTQRQWLSQAGGAGTGGDSAGGGSADGGQPKATKAKKTGGWVRAAPEQEQAMREAEAAAAAAEEAERVERLERSQG